MPYLANETAAEIAAPDFNSSRRVCRNRVMGFLLPLASDSCLSKIAVPGSQLGKDRRACLPMACTLPLKWSGLRLVPSAAQFGYIELYAAHFFQANQNDAPLSPRVGGGRGQRARRWRDRAGRLGLRPLSEWRFDRTASALAGVHRELIIALAAQHKLPAIYYERYFVKDGGLLSYGQIFTINSGVRPLTSTASSREKSRPTCGCRRRPSTSW